jgi:predicted ABC-type ATPase
VIAGPNGSGKSTLTRLVEFEGRARLLDPDAIARQLNPFNSSAAAISAGLEVLRIRNEMPRMRRSIPVRA